MEIVGLVCDWSGGMSASCTVWPVVC